MTKTIFISTLYGPRDWIKKYFTEPEPMKKVVIESPLSAPTRDGIEENKRYAIRCVWDSLKRGEAPYASHLLFDRPGLLDDQVPMEREMGMTAGFAWGDYADLVAVYADHGVSNGMQAGIDRYRHRGIPIEYRYLLRKNNGQ